MKVGYPGNHHPDLVLYKIRIASSCPVNTLHSEEPALLALPSNWPGSACRSASSGNLEIRLHLVRFQETRGCAD